MNYPIFVRSALFLTAQSPQPSRFDVYSSTYRQRLRPCAAKFVRTQKQLCCAVQSVSTNCRPSGFLFVVDLDEITELRIRKQSRTLDAATQCPGTGQMTASLVMLPCTNEPVLT